MSYGSDMAKKAIALKERKKKEPFVPKRINMTADEIDDLFYQRILDSPQDFDVEKTAERIRKCSHFEFFGDPLISREEYIEKYILSPEGRIRMKKAHEQYELDVAEAKRRGLVPGGDGKRVNCYEDKKIRYENRSC